MAFMSRRFERYAGGAKALRTTAPGGGRLFYDGIACRRRRLNCVDGFAKRPVGLARRLFGSLDLVGARGAIELRGRLSRGLDLVGTRGAIVLRGRLC